MIWIHIYRDEKWKTGLNRKNLFHWFYIYTITQNEVVPFFKRCCRGVSGQFTNFEIVCVNDACTDGTIGVLKEYLEENHCSEMVNIIHMSFFHGLESAMNGAGRDLAIGDFIYEFDTA